LHAIQELDRLELPEEQVVGATILKKALEGPIKQIAINGGKDGAEILAHLRGKSERFGYNARTDHYEDLIDAGVIDPTKVVRNALQTASSIAALVLTTEALVADFEDEKDKTDNPEIVL